MSASVEQLAVAQHRVVQSTSSLRTASLHVKPPLGPPAFTSAHLCKTVRILASWSARLHSKGCPLPSNISLVRPGLWRRGVPMRACMREMSYNGRMIPRAPPHELR